MMANAAKERWQEALEELIKVFLKHGEELELGRAVLELSPHSGRLVSNYGASEFVKQFPQLFVQTKRGKSKSKVMVRLDVPLEFCPEAGEKGGCDTRGCTRLHLCPFFIKGSCKFGAKCNRSHTYHDQHTVRVLDNFRLGFLNRDSSTYILQRILEVIVDQSEIQRAANRSSLPDICKFYNKATCKKGDNCPCLHVCEHFIDGDCKFGEGCKREHDFSDPHNRKVLKEFDLGGISELKVLCLLKGRDRKRTASESSAVERPGHGKTIPSSVVQRPSSSSCLPDICKFYNKATCKNGDNCPCLHVCEHFIDGDCKFGKGCKREHDFSSPHSRRVLKDKGMGDSSELEVLQHLMKGRERKRTSSESSDVERPDKMMIQPVNSNPSTARAKDEKEKDTEICGFNLRGKCNYGKGCIHHHTELPYLWEFAVDGDDRWESFSSDINAMLEQAYCDVKHNSCKVAIRGIPYKVQFKDMTAVASIQVNGMSIASSMLKGP